MEKKYFVHESSYVDDNVKIGDGTKIWHFSHVMSNSEMGEKCNIGQNVVISPGVKLGNGVKIQNNVSVYTGVICEDDVFLGPSCVFTNVINPRSFIERKAEYRETIIGKGALIGAGAVVTKNIPDYALVMGNPARIKGYVCKCGEKLSFENDKATCTVCGLNYTKADEKVECNE